MASSSSMVSVVETYWVSPAAAAGGGLEGEGETSLPLTTFDLMWLNSGPVQRIFFYDLPSDTSSTSLFLSGIVPRLISSLSLALRHFFPLAGRVRLSPSSSCDDPRHEIHYSHGDSVALIIAQFDGGYGELEALSGDHPREVAQLQCLVPNLPSDSDTDSKRLLALQATLSPGQGFTIGVTVHHVAGDGSSTTHFLKSWAAACRTEGELCPVPPPPIFDRSFIVDSMGDYAIWKRYIELIMKKKKAKEQEETPAAAVAAVTLLQSTFTLTREHIDKLKEKVASLTMPATRCSTFAVACAFVWTCLCNIKSSSDGQDDDENVDEDELVYFSSAADSRARLEPPVPQAYFGNCLVGVFGEARAKELESEQGVVAAAVAIARGVECLNRKRFKEREMMVQRFMKIGGGSRKRKPLTVAGSPRFEVYGIDFGWGKPRKVEVTSIADTGAISIAESPKEEGGVEIGAAMPQHQLHQFNAQFLTRLCHI